MIINPLHNLTENVKSIVPIRGPSHQIVDLFFTLSFGVNGRVLSNGLHCRKVHLWMTLKREYLACIAEIGLIVLRERDEALHGLGYPSYMKFGRFLYRKVVSRSLFDVLLMIFKREEKRKDSQNLFSMKESQEKHDLQESNRSSSHHPQALPSSSQSSHPMPARSLDGPSKSPAA